MSTLQTVRTNLHYDLGTVRREVFEGVEHLVVPVVMIVEGVLNGAFVPASEFSKYVAAWNGRPVPVLHPERNGLPVSASQPDILEKNSIGWLFNAHVDGSKLKGEAWLNTDKAKRLGYSDLLDALAAGEVIEVSTGYYSDAENKAGEYNGVGYTEIHRNLRPDHLALLPGDVGACSVADGCGTRVNSKQPEGVLMKTKTAINVLAKALGLKTNCECEDSMDILKQAEALKANGSLSAKQFTMLQEMGEDERAMMRALIDALGSVETATGEELPDEMAEDYEDEPMQMRRKPAKAPAAAPAAEAIKTFTEADVEKIVANQLRRAKVTEALTANAACAFDADDLKAMSVDALEKYEQSIRPVDYSGAGGFATNVVDDADANVTPLMPRSYHRKPKEA